jgi:hypothetical protein
MFTTFWCLQFKCKKNQQILISILMVNKIHKHLGITFCEEAKWNKHVENLIKSVSKHICVLRKLKCTISLTSHQVHVDHDL